MGIRGAPGRPAPRPIRWSRKPSEISALRSALCTLAPVISALRTEFGNIVPIVHERMDRIQRRLAVSAP